MCFKCGESGRPARECTKPAKDRKRKRQGLVRQSGKPIGQLEGEEEVWQWQEPEGEDQKEMNSVGAPEERKQAPTNKRTLGQSMPGVFTGDKLGEVCSVSEVRMGEDTSAVRLRSNRHRRTQEGGESVRDKRDGDVQERR